MNGVPDDPGDRTLIAKADRRLGGVDIDIHIYTRHGQIERGDRVAADWKLRLVGINDSEDQGSALHPPPVDEDRDGRTVAPGH